MTTTTVAQAQGTSTQSRPNGYDAGAITASAEVSQYPTPAQHTSNGQNAGPITALVDEPSSALTPQHDVQVHAMPSDSNVQSVESGGRDDLLLGNDGLSASSVSSLSLLRLLSCLCDCAVLCFVLVCGEVRGVVSL